MKKELLMGLSSYREVQEMGPAWSLNGYLYLQIDKEIHHESFLVLLSRLEIFMLFSCVQI